MTQNIIFHVDIQVTKPLFWGGLLAKSVLFIHVKNYEYILFFHFLADNYTIVITLICTKVAKGVFELSVGKQIRNN